ncbi:hypothetical protein pdam_00021422 [Pocillopora damicornis]|uniref:Chromo domain-containing protein n=2 Tax=Pocillopora TaxID=46730 RepID=A0A3M6UYH2_POCDA|nr:hypothetical protein pdam_00021422 [Pocillopora damicornis]CAH3143195.1 unnamed protein product [Pocillopora meandrina]
MASLGRLSKGSTYWEVERLVERQETDETVEYLVQWKGYLPYEASWEPEEGILPRCEELFNWRSPDVAIIPENVCSFRVAVERHLKSRSRLPLRLNKSYDFCMRQWKIFRTNFEMDMPSVSVWNSSSSVDSQSPFLFRI